MKDRTREPSDGRPRRPNRGALLVLLAVVFGLLAAFTPALALALDAGTGDAGDAGADVAAQEGSVDDDPAVARLRQTARDIRGLVAERLPVDVEPQSLFEQPLADEGLVALEAARLAALLRDVDFDAGARRDKRDSRGGRDARDAAGAEAGITPVPPALWAARVDLDRARLSFLELPAARRKELIAAHATRSSAAAATVSDAEQRERDAQQKRDQALQAARDAQSETARVVAEEYARLLDVERAQASFEKTLVEGRKAVVDRREATLALQRRAREARAAGGTPVKADETYGSLRKALRTARDGLDAALDVVGDDAKDVPQAGPDALGELQGAFDGNAAREQRKRVEATANRLGEDERKLRTEQAAQRLDEIDVLNAERLALLPFLSTEKRDAVTGFTQAGLDQAASEVRQLTLIARYHRYAAAAWIVSLGHAKSTIGLTVGGVVLVLLEWLVAGFVFVWARRKTPVLLNHARSRSVENDRVERLTTPSFAARGWGFALLVHRPVEWLGLALLLSWLLPDSAKGVLEVQLVTVIVEWILGGALVVVVVNALAGTSQLVTTREDDTPALRLRSLALVGRVVVAFGLVLVLTSRLVGPGTIYQWVASTCWLASVPVFLVLIRWWRDVVFRRAERGRRKSAFERWVLANRQGWKSFFAAIAGGVYLFAFGAVRAVRNWVGRFNVTRRVLAYLFRRELDKLEAERAEVATAGLPPSEFESLGPDTMGESWIASDADEEVERLFTRLRERRGGVIALVGARGMGKSLLLRRLHAEMPDTLLMQAPKRGVGALRAAFGDQLGLPEDATLEQATSTLAASPLSRAFLLDDAHRFVQPVMGGLATFDALLAAASSAAKTTTWVFAIDDVVWLFLQRARGARPLFDDVVRLRPWREEQIIALLRARTATTTLQPSFERLLDKLPANADEIDRQEALERRAGSYYRLLWDYAAGNPGIALHMWRRSLGQSADGQTYVRFFQAPDSADFEVLPDPALFALRAVLQLAPATPEEIQRATRLRSADVTEALRYAAARGYVEEEDGRYTITWTWLRALALFLQRRHLMVAQ